MKRYETPYIQSPHTNACALASFTMVAKTFFPHTTLDDIKRITRWHDGKVVWAPPFHLWMVENGVRIVAFDAVRYDIWREKGFDAMAEVLDPETFAFYKRNTFEPDVYREDIQKLAAKSGYTYHLQQPLPADLKKALADGAVCEALVDSCALNGKDGFSLHRIVVLSLDEESITLHDPVNPGEAPRAAYKIPLQRFLKAWPSERGGPDSCELCCYYPEG
ncbi:MAG: hypothetical protein AB7E52_02290 [Bdellovibrionales bacterium]